MVRVLHFIDHTEFRNYNLKGRSFSLEVNKNIFPPSPHGKFFAENIRIRRGESVIDIGTGSGFLGIVAAKMGGRVSATDPDSDAIETAKRNAKRNKVSASFSRGKFFAGFKGKFDVIIANLPCEILPQKYKSAIGKKLAGTIDGGKNGNSQQLRFLDLAKRHMHENSRLYIILYTLSNYTETLRKMLRQYECHLVAFDTAPTKEFVEDNIAFYQKLSKKGLISIFKNKTVWNGHEYLFKLNLKKSQK